MAKRGRTAQAFPHRAPTAHCGPHSGFPTAVPSCGISRQIPLRAKLRTHFSSRRKEGKAGVVRKFRNMSPKANDNTEGRGEGRGRSGVFCVGCRLLPPTAVFSIQGDLFAWVCLECLECPVMPRIFQCRLAAAVRGPYPPFRPRTTQNEHTKYTIHTERRARHWI